MPKRRLEEAHSSAEGLDGEWVGRWVMLKPAVAQRKRLPETLVAKISHVSRSGMTASVLLEYSADGVHKTYTDNFHRWEALSTRYTQVQEAAAPFEKAQFLFQWCFQGPMKSAPLSGESLSAILPAFQPETKGRRRSGRAPLSVPRWRRCSPAPSDHSTSRICSRSRAVI